MNIILENYEKLKSIQQRKMQTKFPYDKYLYSKIIFTGKTLPIIVKHEENITRQKTHFKKKEHEENVSRQKEHLKKKDHEKKEAAEKVEDEVEKVGDEDEEVGDEVEKVGGSPPERIIIYM